MPVDPNETLDRLAKILQDQIDEHPDDYGIAPVLEMYRADEMLGVIHFFGDNRSDQFMPITRNLISILGLDTITIGHDAYMLKPQEPGTELADIKRGSLQEAFELGDPDVSECLCVSVASRDGRWDDARRPYVVVGRELVWGNDVELKGATVGGYVVEEVREGFAMQTLVEYMSEGTGVPLEQWNARQRDEVRSYVTSIIETIVARNNPLMLLKTQEQLDLHPLEPLMPC